MAGIAQKMEDIRRNHLAAGGEIKDEMSSLTDQLEANLSLLIPVEDTHDMDVAGSEMLEMNQDQKPVEASYDVPKQDSDTMRGGDKVEVQGVQDFGVPSETSGMVLPKQEALPAKSQIPREPSYQFVFRGIYRITKELEEAQRELEKEQNEYKHTQKKLRCIQQEHQQDFEKIKRLLEKVKEQEAVIQTLRQTVLELKEKLQAPSK